MTDPLVLTVVSAGLGTPSATGLLADQIADATLRSLVGADAAHEGAAAAIVPVEVHHVRLREHAQAIAEATLVGFPTGDLKSAVAAVSGADALVVVTPVFQASYSGLFKSFFDLVEAGTLAGTPVLLAATGGTERHSLVVDHALRPLFTYLGATTVPTGVYAATSDFGGDGAAALGERIDRAAAELASLVVGGSTRRAKADVSSPVTPFAKLLERR